MKLSKVINALSQIKEDHGDIDLVVTNDSGDERILVTDVGVNTELGGGDPVAYVSAEV